MENIKKTIIILLVLVVVILICILVLKKQTQEGGIMMLEVDTSQDFINEMDFVSDNVTFFFVESMLDNYFKKVAINNGEAIYSLLDSTYIKQNNITKENILKQIPDIIKNTDNIRIRKIYGQTNLENEEYYVHCILEQNGVGEENYFVIYNDRKNVTYSIAHITREDFVKEVTDENKELELKTIEPNEYNQIITETPSESEIANKYFKDFIGNAVYYTEYTYNILDEKYKEKRFPTLEDFEKYIEDKKDLYSAMVTKKTYDDFDNMEDYVLYITKKQQLQLQSYQIRYEDDYTRYICMDNYNNYYVFYVTTPLNYTVMLDTYTIDMPEFTQKYEVATTEEKVGYNIEKIVNALNGEDYKYIYSKLADEFKANYFKTYEDFEKYAKETFDIKNNVTYNRYTESEELSTYQITLSGRSKTITKTIVMKLEEGTDFVMSFDVE